MHAIPFKQLNTEEGGNSLGTYDNMNNPACQTVFNIRIKGWEYLKIF